VAVTFTDGVNLIIDNLYISPLFSITWLRDIVDINGLKIVGQCDVKHIMTLPIMPDVNVSAYIITSMTNRPVRFTNAVILYVNTWIISTTNLVKIGRHDFSLSWHKGEVRENLGDFRTACMYFNVSFPATACPPTFQKTNLLHNNLKKEATCYQQVWNKILKIKPYIHKVHVYVCFHIGMNSSIIGGISTDSNTWP
jgi:hypothetical protein